MGSRRDGRRFSYRRRARRLIQYKPRGSEIPNPREYNPATNTWVTKSAVLPGSSLSNLAGGMLVMTGTNYIVAVGGSPGGGVSTTGDVRLYNPVADTLSILGSDPWPAGAISSMSQPST